MSTHAPIPRSRSGMNCLVLAAVWRNGYPEELSLVTVSWEGCKLDFSDNMYDLVQAIFLIASYASPPKSTGEDS